LTTYLIAINQIDLLPLLFGRILIPETVRDELASLKAPLSVQQWIAAPPEWLAIEPTLPCTDTELLSKNVKKTDNEAVEGGIDVKDDL
jgi:predicted nucleic acid-binding protein